MVILLQTCCAALTVAVLEMIQIQNETVRLDHVLFPVVSLVPVVRVTIIVHLFITPIQLICESHFMNFRVVDKSGELIEIICSARAFLITKKKQRKDQEPHALKEELIQQSTPIPRVLIV